MPIEKPSIWRVSWTSLWVLFYALATQAPSQCEAAGVVLTKEIPSQSEEFWKPAPFTRIERFTFAVVIYSADGGKTTIPNAQVGKTIEMPDLAKASLVTGSDIASWKTLRQEITTGIAQYRSAAQVLKALLAEVDGVISRFDAGNVLLSGKWVTRAEYDRSVREAAGGGQKTMASLAVRGTTLRNARVTAVRGDKISLLHEGGMLVVGTQELAPEDLKRLQWMAPEHFRTTQTTSVAPPSTPAAVSSVPTSPTDALSSSEVITELKLAATGTKGVEVLRGVRILLVESDGIKVSHTGGLAKIPLVRLPPELQAKLEPALSAIDAPQANSPTGQTVREPATTKSKEPSPVASQERLAAWDLHFQSSLAGQQKEAEKLDLQDAYELEHSRPYHPQENPVLVIKGLYIGMPFQFVWLALRDKFKQDFILEPSDSPFIKKEKGPEGTATYYIVTADKKAWGTIGTETVTGNLYFIEFNRKLITEIFNIRGAMLFDEFAQRFIDEYGIPELRPIRDSGPYGNSIWKYEDAQHLSLTIRPSTGTLRLQGRLSRPGLKFGD